VRGKALQVPYIPANNSEAMARQGSTNYMAGKRMFAPWTRKTHTRVFRKKGKIAKNHSPEDEAILFPSPRFFTFFFLHRMWSLLKITHQKLLSLFHLKVNF
jgi:hypothetical protein